MDILERQDYHPLLETLGLLYLRRNFDVIKADLLRSLQDLETDSEGFYNKHLGYLEDYVGRFGEKYIPGECEEFFFRFDTEFFLLVVQLFLEIPGLEEEVSRLSDEELRTRLVPYLNANREVRPLETVQARYALVSETELPEQTKWKLLTLLESPRALLEELVTLYHLNLPAYEFTMAENRTVLDRLRREVPEGLSPALESVASQLAEGPLTVHLTAVFPLTEWLMSHTVVRGVLTDRLTLYRQGRAEVREALPGLLKHLGDKSKFEILCSLKERGKYNLELAEDVGLSAATVSHHMGLLLGSQLVSVEKRGGKVYYQLNRETVQNLLADLEEILL